VPWVSALEIVITTSSQLSPEIAFNQPIAWKPDQPLKRHIV